MIPPTLSSISPTSVNAGTLAPALTVSGEIGMVWLKGAKSPDVLSIAQDSAVTHVNNQVRVNGTLVATYAIAPVPVGVRCVYKRVGDRGLGLWITPPSVPSPNAIVLFHGGGWVSGSPGAFVMPAEHWAALGFVVISVEYRFADISALMPPLESVQDARDAVRWVRDHADEFGIDRIAILGQSAGGHLAAYCAFVVAVGDALLLECAPIRNGPGDWGYRRLGAEFPQYSPWHHISSIAPPTCATWGGSDDLTPAEMRDAVQQSMMACDVPYISMTILERGHGFCSYGWNNLDYYATFNREAAWLSALWGLPLPALLEMPVTRPINDQRPRHLTITFGSLATSDDVQEVLRRVTLTTAMPGTRTLTWQAANRNGTKGAIVSQEVSSLL